MNNFNNYLKKKKIIKDILREEKVHMFFSLFNSKETSKLYFKKKNIPLGWHWLYFSDNFFLEETDSDGHQKRGAFFPKFKGCKRMFAGSEIIFLNNLALNSLSTKISQISKIENKSKNKKKIYFVTVKNTYKVKNKNVLIENQKLVFIEKNYKSKKKIKEQNEGYKVISKRNVCFNNVILFRYSAITYNSHRIHYDQEYTKKKEGYKDLLVHGPLLASYALEQFRRMKNLNLESFKFKMLKPVNVNENVIFKILKNLENKKNFRITIVNKNSKEAKFVASCNIK
ncbi:MAG: Mesaconyl-C(4)-CoA hydratase [Alphaproteobacteria bacterium MarineAlpha9_Bin4]|nr:MAG: Mesaconyl-C(4)-CoA hydratase [Alphaproteobacteria bacterium MarineAlpha9_Bin4]|tara:strand:+ start:237 stop:1088 length:852 start_codon:yes stop_codon:yes gene_type:complete